jgi:dCTP deaminase
MGKMEFNRTELAYEFMERCVRLYDHIELSCRAAILPGTRPTVQLAIGEELKSHLFTLLEDSFKFVDSNPIFSDFKKYFEDRLQHLAVVHIFGLPRIPRAHEPIEIVSYLRQTVFGSLDQVRAKKYANLRIFSTERLGNETHMAFSLAQAKMRLRLNDITNVTEMLEKLTEREEETIPLISLPRIDLNSPSSWPILFHELAHIEVSIDDVWSNYLSLVKPSQQKLALDAIADYSATSDPADVQGELRSWLLECWCDAFGVVCAGPAIFFAQLHSFAFSSPGYMRQNSVKGLKYPPAWFRLKLILAFSQARLDGAHEETRKMVCKAMEDEKKLIANLVGQEVLFDSNLSVLISVFKEFIRTAFPRQDYQLGAQISSSNLRQLVEDLSLGLPIPSINDTSEGEPQRAASPAEILLAGWIYRCTELRKKFESSLFPKDSARLVDAQTVVAQVKRADESLKRSIQMAEWFAILNKASIQEPTKQEGISEADLLHHVPAGVLSDRDLKVLMLAKKLRIIPLIDPKFQIRGTVIDLRLGHNFEIFPSSVPRIVDAMLDSDDNISDSVEVDIDFGQGMDIGPGQFMLAHTLEYIKLPTNVAAQVEGRSSFARIGLQVHMTANLVEAGFDGCLTLEILNSGPSSIRLYPGMRIAQLRFFRLASEPQYPYGHSGENKYRGRLSHNKTRQFSDWETKAIDDAKLRFSIKG